MLALLGRVTNALLLLILLSGKLQVFVELLYKANEHSFIHNRQADVAPWSFPALCILCRYWLGKFAKCE
ncbi:hypothetical protein D3C86_1584430 [compost metagenome]